MDPLLPLPWVKISLKQEESDGDALSVFFYGDDY